MIKHQRLQENQANQNSSIVMRSIILFLIATTVTATIVAADSPVCLDEDGKPVDWYIVYKFPQLSDQVEPFNTGHAYAYITSNSVSERDPTFWAAPEDADLDTIVFLNQFRRLLVKYLGYPLPVKKPSMNDWSGRTTRARARRNLVELRKGLEIKDDLYWTISGKLITDPDSIILRTLAVAYKHTDKAKSNVLDNLNTIFYNDGPPQQTSNESSSTPKSANWARAHAKGVLMIDEESENGVWLTHSTPQFPPPRTMDLKFNPNSRRYGQTFMCISFDVNRSGKQIVHHLANMNPLVYDSYVSKRLYELIPELSYLKLESDTSNKRRKKYEDSRVAQVITTRGGQDLYVYSKSADFGEDLYSGWMDHDLKTTLFVETWRKGAGVPLNSDCPVNDYRVNNVQDLKVMDADKKITWSYSQDHSKWAISEEKDPGVVCISDVNRMQSQFKRGGGAVCIKCPSCWSVFSSTILDLEPCPIKPPIERSLSTKSEPVFDDTLYEKLKRLLGLNY